MRMKQRGVTVIELLIVVVIVGILASVAMSSYTSFIAKSYRTEAQRELHRVANLQEQYFADHKTYTTDMTKLGLGADPYIPSEGNYSIDSAAVSAIGSDFIATATATGKQATNDAECGVMTLNSVGVKTSKQGATVTTSECW